MLNRLLRCPCRLTMLHPTVHSQILIRGAKAKAAAGGGKAKGGKAMGKPVLTAETDAKKLLSQVCGLNYATEGPLSEPIHIKPDSEYPDWLFKLDIKRPKPSLEQMDPSTKEYWEKVKSQMDARHRRILQLRRK
uniref:Large ribosomal subunit protein mL54 n=1 Tax=Labidocera rotunda TaxID=207950 RepID=A0A0U2V7X8_9MAXI|nr:mitochondrial 39S ribosomal protein L54 [Labidocera rotunda]